MVLNSLKKKRLIPFVMQKNVNAPLFFFFFLERVYFMDITQQKSTTYQRPAWYGVYDLKRMLSFYV